MFFSDEAWFHLQGYRNTQNNRYCFIGKIRVRLAASGTPVAVKRRVVESVNKVNSLPVLN
jgi:hypothetical protein